MVNFLQETKSYRQQIANIIIPKRSHIVSFFYNLFVAMFVIGITIPHFVTSSSINMDILKLVDYVIGSFLIIDLLLRFFIFDIFHTPTKGNIRCFFKTLFHPLIIIDILIIISMFVNFYWLLFLRLFKVFRVMKATRFWLGIILIKNSFHSEKNTLLFLLIFTVLILLIATSIIYWIEEQDNVEINSFLDALWFVFLTFSTIGFGDVVVVTEWGKIVTIIVSMFSITMLAITSGILFFSFSNQLQNKRVYVGGRKIKLVRKSRIIYQKDKQHKISYFDEKYNEYFGKK